MKVWILYDSLRFVRNQAFAQKLEQAFHSRDVAVRVIADGQLPADEPWPEAAVMRFVNPDVSRKLERNNVQVINCSHVSEIANDKWVTTRFVQSLGLPVMRTALLPSGSPLPESWRFPIVLKSRFGHGGTEVFWIPDAESLQAAFSRISDPVPVIQEPASDIGKDVRVYVLGGRILKAMLRQSNSDFRSNYCLGGSASEYEPEPAIQEAVARICAHVPLDFAGVDFIFDHGQPVFNELEDVVGCRMLYSLTNLDPAALLASHVYQLVQNRIQ